MIIGIDLGTTNSLVSVFKDAKSELIANPLGSNLTPSVVSITEDGSILVGQAAKERLSSHPGATTAEFKRFMGTNKEINLGSKTFRAEELSSFIIRALKEDAEAYLGEPVSEAVITVPAYFSDAQRKATKIAGELAGLKVERLLNEPTAAAMSYGLHTQASESQYLIFDLGGGTFDISILEMFDGVMEVHASAGDNYLGGSDFTQKIAEYFIAEKGQALGVTAKKMPRELHQRLIAQAEKSKKELCDNGASTLHLQWHGKQADLTINEAQFETLCTDLLDRIARPIRQALRDAKVMVADIDEIVLVGGATRMPAIRKLCTRLFQRFPAKGLNPDEVVAHGAAIQAGLKSRDGALEDLVLTDVCPYTLGVEVAKGEDNNIMSGHFQPVIERNNYIPISRSEELHTLSDNQKTVDLKIFQGESPMVKDNIFLGKITVNLPPAPAGQESIDVRFTYDINGILEVIVTVLSTQQTFALVIEENPGVLTSKEIEERLKKLETLKIHPKESQINTATLNRAERLYRELLGQHRAALGEWIAKFQQLLEQQDLREIETFRKSFDRLLDELDETTPF